MKITLQMKKIVDEFGNKVSSKKILILKFCKFGKLDNKCLEGSEIYFRKDKYATTWCNLDKPNTKS